MIPAQIKVDVDQEEIQKYIKERLDQQVRNELIFIDIKGLEEITSCSRRWLEEEVLIDPRMRLAERRKNRKRLWVFEEAKEALLEIAEEW